MASLKACRKHFATITRHKWEVFKACCVAGIPWQGVTHDLSKYSLTEFFSSAEYFQGTRSPIDAEKEAKGYSLAWQHHKGHNPHHYEYWFDNLDSGGVPLVMPFKYVLEMICDWIGAGKVYGGAGWTIEEPLRFWEKKKKTARIHPATVVMIDATLGMFAEDGYPALLAAKTIGPELYAQVQEEIKNG